jgi:hypothetical protein
MWILMKDRTTALHDYLNALREAPLSGEGWEQLPRRVSTIALDSREQDARRVAGCLFEYDIFPRQVMTSLSQWSAERRTMQVGDVIVQHVYLPAFLPFAIKLVFGVRVTDVFESSTCAGFSISDSGGTCGRGAFDVCRSTERGRGAGVPDRDALAAAGCAGEGDGSGFRRALSEVLHAAGAGACSRASGEGVGGDALPCEWRLAQRDLSSPSKRENARHRSFDQRRAFRVSTGWWIR